MRRFVREDLDLRKPVPRQRFGIRYEFFPHAERLGLRPPGGRLRRSGRGAFGLRSRWTTVKGPKGGTSDVEY
jgi:hypothetical protein